MNTSTGLLVFTIVATSALYVTAARNDTIFTKKVQGREFTLETKEEDLAIRQFLVDLGSYYGTYGSFRTSGRKLGSSYMWTSTGKEFNYTAWNVSEPDDPNVDACVDIQDIYGWFNADCAVTDVLFICEQTDA
ncbi:hypothetical protein B566_EDAN017505 [Ephemera danica]|nr:hypothetical protein B566_EDAN017505 [Ephemera danica]